MFENLFPIFISLAIAFGGCHLLIRKGSQQLLDIPNQRSSHSNPTPRAGGIAIFAAVLVTTLLTRLLAENAHQHLAYSWPVAALAVFGISLLDDILNVRILWRLAIQFAAAILVLLQLDTQDYNPIAVTGFFILGIFTTIWMTNLYNFMDGINGIAGLEALSFCIGTLILTPELSTTPEGKLLIAIAAANLGFLYWNFPKAKIFMGDSGSATLGFIFATLTISTATHDLKLATSWIILLGVFITDASFTLARRLLTGQKFYAPHRSHSYQRSADLIGHSKTSLIIVTINLFWLLPIALLVNKSALNPLLGLAVAFGPLIAIAVMLKAGKAS